MFLVDLNSKPPSISPLKKLKSWSQIWGIIKNYVNCKVKLAALCVQKQVANEFDFQSAWRTKWFVASATLMSIIVSPAPAQAWPEKGLVTHKEDDNGKYTIVDFKQQNCKISGPLIDGLDLYACFAYLSEDASVISLSYLIASEDIEIRKRIQCKLSDNPNQALIFHPQYKDNESRKSFITTVKSRNVEKDDNGIYYGSIVIDGWWLRSNKFVNMGLKDARANDICGLSIYFKPSKKFIRAINDLSK
ncbi:hypothetical protein KR100_06805 [Synechococcus sp. KORDI-100]|uniref:hypothetical protein n=1 Tax=Synechococcus sp. KORDI-100 TaxID=1280380 RepID=UPI0004E086CD|nr:hypothetical protein [Synechococcus sp. KORDI-100]AII43074.1 hypothetical protein KR100_06805 [Synechococcus sp. KORDI-100]